jgi:hypothetical protein
MNSLSKAVGIGFLSFVCGLALSTVAFSVDREVYDKPQAVQPGKTIHGKIIKIDELNANQQRWDVSVQSIETGEVVVVHIDKTTNRKEGQMEPDLGDNVIVKYDEPSKHAITFLTDARSHN